MRRAGAALPGGAFYFDKIWGCMPPSRPPFIYTPVLYDHNTGRSNNLAEYVIYCAFFVPNNLKYVSFFYSVGVHVLVEDVNEFAPKWKIRSNEKSSESEPVHTLATNVAIEEGQLLEEVRKRRRVDTDQDFLCQLGMKPYLYLELIPYKKHAPAEQEFC